MTICEPIITTRFKYTDFKKCCVLNTDTNYERLDKSNKRHTIRVNKNSKTKKY